MFYEQCDSQRYVEIEISGVVRKGNNIFAPILIALVLGSGCYKSRSSMRVPPVMQVPPHVLDAELCVRREALKAAFRLYAVMSIATLSMNVNRKRISLKFPLVACL